MRVVLSTIKAKIALVVVAGIVSAVLLVSVTTAWREMTRRVVDKQTALTAVGEALAATLAQPLARGDAADSARALRAVRQMPAIRYARVVDSGNQTLAQFGVGIVLAENTDATAPLKPGSLSTLQRRHLAFAVPIISGGAPVGRLDLVADISDLRTVFWSSVWSALVSAIVAALIGLLVSSRMQPLVTGPIAALTRAMYQIRTTQDFARIVERQSNDEAGELVDAFNDMLSHIRERDLQLAVHRASLEQQVEDRTAELVKAKRAAETANSAKSDFLAAMSHEIRTPMHGMMAMTELLLAGELPDKQRRQVEIVERSGRSLLAIVNDILDFSKIEAGRMELESIPVSPVEIAEQVAQLFAARAADKGLQLDISCGEGVPAGIKGDPVRLTQVLSNLVGNALKFTEKGSIRVSLEMAPGTGPAERRLRFAVTDTGIGIPAQALGRIFDAFSQADQSTTRKFGGTGIGLAICRRLVAAMGGKIEVASTVGRGTTFSFSIPVEAAALPSTARKSESKLRTSFKGLRVLAADDNAVNREVLEQALGLLGIKPVLVEDGAGAVAAYKSQPFDAVFMDCSMPVLDGFAATREIRAFEARHGRTAVPVVALTAFVIGKEATAWRDAGMSDCLTKPFTVRGLSDCLTRHAAARAEKVDAPAPDADLPGDDPLLDHEVLDGIQHMDKNGSIIRRIVGLFVTTAPDHIERIRQAAAAGATAEIAAAAHALKSMSLTIGARRLAGIAGGIEQAAAGIEAEHGDARVDTLAAELDAAIAALNAKVEVFAGEAAAKAAIIEAA